MCCSVPLPPWVLEEVQKNPDLIFTDKNGKRNPEYLSLGADNVPALKGRTPIQCYADFMRSFRDNFQDLLGDVIIVSFRALQYLTGFLGMILRYAFVGCFCWACGMLTRLTCGNFLGQISNVLFAIWSFRKFNVVWDLRESFDTPPIRRVRGGGGFQELVSSSVSTSIWLPV